MRKTVSDCQGCVTDKGCRGRRCPYYSRAVYECDRCKDEINPEDALCVNARTALKMLCVMLPLLLMAFSVNIFFNNQGSTELVKLPTGNSLTLESLLYSAFTCSMRRGFTSAPETSGEVSLWAIKPIAGTFSA